MRIPTIRGRISCNLATDFDGSTRVRAVKGSKALKAGDLKAHEACQDTMQVSSLYEVSPPGPYSMQVEPDLPWELGQGVVKSNTITATMTP
jgi:hypothetical protein